jgi:hypothetical protein
MRGDREMGGGEWLEREAYMFIDHRHLVFLRLDFPELELKMRSLCRERLFIFFQILFFSLNL